MRPATRICFALLFVVAAALPGCNGFFPEAKLASIAITPASPSLVDGTNQLLSAKGTYDDGTSKTLTTIKWTSSDPSTVKVDETGLATAMAIGSANIVASEGDVVGTTTVTVTAAALRTITISPVDPIIRLSGGSTQQFTAIGTYSDASSADLSSSVTWASSNTNVVSISSTGLATASSLKGTTTISATSGTVNTSTTLTVIP